MKQFQKKRQFQKKISKIRLEEANELEESVVDNPIEENLGAAEDVSERSIEESFELSADEAEDVAEQEVAPVLSEEASENDAESRDPQLLVESSESAEMQESVDSDPTVEAGEVGIESAQESLEVIVQEEAQQQPQFIYQPNKLQDAVLRLDWFDEHPLPERSDCERMSAEEYDIFEMLYQSAQQSAIQSEAVTHLLDLAALAHERAQQFDLQSIAPFLLWNTNHKVPWQNPKFSVC